MSRSKKIYVLLGVLAVICLITFGVSRYEEKKEQIKNSDEVVLELETEDVTALSWEYDEQTLAFHKDENWLYDEDENFPVNEEKISELLEPFQEFGVSFIIEDVEDYGQYGLEDPICTIKISTEEKDYEILLGDYSTMDEERYVSIGDGNVYLVQNDPMEFFEIELKDMIQNDKVPEYDEVTELQFKGSQNYKAEKKEENKVTYSDDDTYFVEEDGEELALDTANVESYLQSLDELNLSDYVSYDASEEELASYGLDDPELTVTMKYTYSDEEDEEEQEDTFVLSISRDSKQRKEEADEKEEDSEEEITAYARVGESPIIYKIAGESYKTLMAASYDELRHQKIFWGDFSDIQKIEISLEDQEYTLTTKKKGDDVTWYYEDEELEIDDFKQALNSLSTTDFTDEKPSDKEEISLTIYLDNENQPEVQIELFRYDGNNCLAVVDGEPTALVERNAVVDLVEAVNAIVLN
ncbi:DUF4340 domain-containing protein [Sporofaciens sp. SGI.106]|uniref:DUF4340 domain-containing protein n=1 Tax=Sporofaciens sp. SGI.106 TaxID=3420568 RepID=UPI003CFF1ED9